MISEQGILYIEPSGDKSEQPVVDDLTRMMTAALHQSTPIEPHSKGFHSCVCGAISSCYDFCLPNGEETNTLAIHYLAYHRDEVPEAQLNKVRQLDCGLREPTQEEMESRQSLGFNQ